MKKLTLKKESLLCLGQDDLQAVAGGYSVEPTCTSPDTQTAEPTVCRVFTDMAYCNTTKCPTYKGCKN